MGQDAINLAGSVKEKSASVLEDLQQVQSETFQLISILEARLSVVSETTPEASDKATSGSYVHLFQALDNQYNVNRQLRKLIDELKV